MLLGFMLLGGGVLLVNGGIRGVHPWQPVADVLAPGTELPEPGSGAVAASVTGPGVRQVGPHGGAAGGSRGARGARLGDLTRSTLSPRQVNALARAVGFSRSEAAIMTAIAFRESRYQPRAYNPAGPGNGAWGLWQIAPGSAALFDPMANAQAARAKFLASQRAGYSGFRPWASTAPAGVL